MRVIAGMVGGRRLVAPKGDVTRPTSDRVRESVMGALHMDLPGARVLDLYAGTGAMGIEALSRGAAHVTFVERHRRALEAIATNLDACGYGDDLATVVADDVTSFLATSRGEQGGFDLALLDPPYGRDGDDLASVLAALVPWLVVGGRVRVEQDRRTDDPRWPEGLRPGRVRRYGDTTIHEASRSGVIS